MKRLTIAVLPLAALALAVSRADAQPPGAPPARLSVEEAVARALATSPRLGRLASLQVAAEAQRKGAAAERWPQVEVGAGYQRRSEVTELQIVSPTQDPAMPLQLVTIFPSIEDNYRLRAGASLPLYTGGRLSSQVRAAEEGRLAAEHDVSAARADLVLEVKTAYWGLVTAREGARVLQEAIGAFDAHLSDARNRERFGMAARNEVLAVQVERDRAELNLLRAQSGADISEANLRRLLDLAPAVRIEPSDALATSPVASPDVEALVAQASAARPDRSALAARASAASALAGAERGARLPQVALVAGYGYANPNRDIVPPAATWQDTWDVGVSLSWSLLDGGKRSAGEARARAQAAAARQQLLELEGAIRLEVTQRSLELRTAEATLAVAERGLLSATESRRVAADRYREGVIPSSELLDAELAKERAALAQTEAMAAVRLATAGLDRAVGR